MLLEICIQIVKLKKVKKNRKCFKRIYFVTRFHYFQVRKTPFRVKNILERGKQPNSPGVILFLSRNTVV